MNSEPQWLPSELSVMRPAEQIHPAEWVPKRFRLPRDSAIKGYCDLALLPQFLSVLNWILDDEIDEIYICSSSQSGKTTIILGALCYLVKQKRWSAGVIFADQETSEEISTKRFAPAWEDDQELAKDIDYTAWTKVFRGFIGGHSVKFTWASSVASTASWSAGFVYADEIDKPGYSIASKEGDKMFYIKQRLESYWGSKFLASSTPTDEDGNITAVQRQKDVLVHDFHVPCPYCGQAQPLKFSSEYAYGFPDGKYRGEDGKMHKLGRVVWEGGREATPEQIQRTARYECGECGKHWTTAQKNKTLSLGRAVPRTDPAGQRKYYLHNSRLTSLFKGGRLEKLVEEFVSILQEPDRMKRDEKMQAWVQNALAEPYKKVLIELSPEKFRQAITPLPPQTIPEEAIALTCTVDVQKHGRWFVVRAWAKDTTSWLIHYGLLGGWEDIEDLLFSTTYPVAETGQRMGFWRCAVDTGGGEGDEGLTMTEDTEIWLHKNQRRGLKIWGTKGSSHALGQKCKVGSNLVKTPSGKTLPGGLQIVMLDADRLKEAFLYRLDLAAQGHPQGAYLHADTDDVYFSHITAEQKQRDPRTGKEEWKKLRARNDLLDCEAMGLALIDSSWPMGGINLITGRANVGGTGPVTQHKQSEQESSSGWLGGTKPGWLPRR